MPTAKGVSAAMVPQLVPMLSEMKHEARKMPGKIACSGEIHRRIHCAHRLGRSGKSTGEDEDGKHQHHRRVSCALGKDLDAFVHRASHGQ